MNLSPRTKQMLFFCGLIVGTAALYVFMASMLIDLITAAYNQIVDDFGSPR